MVRRGSLQSRQRMADPTANPSALNKTGFSWETTFQGQPWVGLWPEDFHPLEHKWTDPNYLFVYVNNVFLAYFDTFLYPDRKLTSQRLSKKSELGCEGSANVVADRRPCGSVGPEVRASLTGAGVRGAGELHTHGHTEPQTAALRRALRLALFYLKTKEYFYILFHSVYDHKKENKTVNQTFPDCKFNANQTGPRGSPVAAAHRTLGGSDGRRSHPLCACYTSVSSAWESSVAQRPMHGRRP